MSANDKEYARSIYNTHRGFTIICDNCKNSVVWVENTIQLSKNKTVVGNLSLVCDRCDYTLDLADFR